MDSKGYRKKAFEAYKTRLGEWLPMSLVLFLMAGCCCALSLLGALWVLLGIALLFMPTLFAVTQYLGASMAGKPMETSVITRAFGAYFRPNGLGVYRFMRNGLLAFVSTLGVGFTVIFVFYMVAAGANPEFASVLETVQNALAAGNYESANAALASSATMNLIYDVFDLVMGFALIFFCWLFVGKYAQNGLMRNAFHLSNPNLANFYYAQYRSIVAKKWRSARAPFLAFPLSFLLIGGGVSAICYAYGTKANFSLFFGLLAFAFLFSLYLPLYIYLSAAFVFDNDDSVSKAFYQGSEKIYQRFASSGAASEEELARMRDELDKMKPHDPCDNEKEE